MAKKSKLKYLIKIIYFIVKINSFEKFEHRRNLLQTPGQGLPGLQGLGK